MTLKKTLDLTFCHWNLNGLIGHDSTKISLLQAYITQHNYDIICLTETFLNSSIQSRHNRITIEGYNLIRSDHPSDSKKGGVCIYYKEHIPLILRDDINTLNNYLVTGIRLQNEKCFLTCIYRSPSQIRMSLSASALALWIKGSLRFVTSASWYGEKPCILVKEFFAFADQSTARSISHLLPARILSSRSANIRLCHSIKPLLQGDSTLVVLTVIRLSQSYVNKLFADSPPLSVKYFGMIHKLRSKS